MDVIEVHRVARCILNPRFLDKVFTWDEQEYLTAHKMNSQSAAGTFAAKEAVSKALGTGFGRIKWTEVEILRDEAGRPYAVLHGSAYDEMVALGGSRMWVTITHTREYAAAQAILEE